MSLFWQSQGFPWRQEGHISETGELQDETVRLGIRQLFVPCASCQVNYPFLLLFFFIFIHI